MYAAQTTGRSPGSSEHRSGPRNAQPAWSDGGGSVSRAGVVPDSRRAESSASVKISSVRPLQQ